ncbi:MAG: hypothetical protein ACP5UA_14220 [Candidatus Hydrogenedens sp.]
MHITNFIKNYPCILLTLLLTLISPLFILSETKVYASTKNPKSGECDCISQTSCPYNLTYAIYGLEGFKCGLINNHCKCNGPDPLKHCSYPKAELCAPTSGGCSCSNDCMPSDCPRPCYPSSCEGCKEYQLSTIPCSGTPEPGNCGRCNYKFKQPGCGQ